MAQAVGYTRDNAARIAEVTRLAAALGARGHHLLWVHKRGRADGGGVDVSPDIETLIAIVRRCREVARECGIVVDNHESIKARLRRPSGTRRDLSNACVTSLCVYSDGRIYPSAAMANVPDLQLGSIQAEGLAPAWRNSDVAAWFRSATVARKPICGECPLEFLCGGGDIEHSWFYGGSLDAHDPYCELHKAMFRANGLCPAKI